MKLFRHKDKTRWKSPKNSNPFYVFRPQLKEIINNEILDATTSETALVDGEFIFWMTLINLCLLAQCAWNTSVKRMELFPRTLSKLVTLWFLLSAILYFYVQVKIPDSTFGSLWKINFRKGKLLAARIWDLFHLQQTASIREQPLQVTWATIAEPTLHAAAVREPTM